MTQPKTRIFISASEHGLVEFAKGAIMHNDKQRGDRKITHAETMALRQEIAEILEREKDERGNYFASSPPEGWQNPGPIAERGSIPPPPPQMTPSSSSTGRSLFLSEAATTYESGGVKLTSVPEEGSKTLAAW